MGKIKAGNLGVMHKISLQGDHLTLTFSFMQLVWATYWDSLEPLGHGCSVVWCDVMWCSAVRYGMVRWGGVVLMKVYVFHNQNMHVYLIQFYSLLPTIFPLILFRPVLTRPFGIIFPLWPCYACATMPLIIPIGQLIKVPWPLDRQHLVGRKVDRTDVGNMLFNLGNQKRNYHKWSLTMLVKLIWAFSRNSFILGHWWKALWDP